MLKNGTGSENRTTDKIFLLNVKEAEEYFTSDEERSCNANIWWLREPGYRSGGVSYVTYSGDIDEKGTSDDKEKGVRPALWVFPTP